MGFSGDDLKDMHLNRVPIENTVIAAAVHSARPRPLQLQDGETVDVELQITGPDGTTQMFCRAVVMCADGNGRYLKMHCASPRIKFTLSQSTDVTTHTSPY